MLHVLQFVICAILGIWGLIRDGQSYTSLMSNLHLSQTSNHLNEIETKE
jgi:hypothetical protein